MQLHPIVMCGQRFAKTADHVTVRRELPPRKHGFEFGDGGIDDANKPGETLFVQEKGT